MSESQEIQEYNKFKAQAINMLHFVKISMAVKLYNSERLSLTEACEFASLKQEELLQLAQTPHDIEPSFQ